MSSSRSNSLLITLYYDDVARYFLQLESFLLQKNFEITYVCHNLSAFLLLRQHSSQSVVYVNGIKTRFVYLLNFLCSIGHRETVPEYVEKLADRDVDRARWTAEILTLKQTRSEFKRYFDCMILSGQDRPLEWMFSKKNSARIYFEQGPFNTTTLSRWGVNVNTKPDPDLPRFFGPDVVPDDAYLERSEAMARPARYRLLDFAQYFVARLFGVGLPSEDADWRTLRSKVKRYLPTSNHTVVTDATPSKGRRVLVVLQVHADVNNLLHSPGYRLGEILESLQQHQEWEPTLNVRVRLHPMESSKIRRHQIAEAQYANVRVSEGHLRDDFAWSDVVLTANSTVGIEAYRSGLPVVAFGQSYWSKLLGVKFAHTLDELAAQVKAAYDERHSIGDVARAGEVHKLLRSHFVPGHFRCRSLYPQEVANWIEWLNTTSKRQK